MISLFRQKKPTSAIWTFIGWFHLIFLLNSSIPIIIYFTTFLALLSRFWEIYKHILSDCIQKFLFSYKLGHNVTRISWFYVSFLGYKNITIYRISNDIPNFDQHFQLDIHIILWSVFIFGVKNGVICHYVYTSLYYHLFTFLSYCIFGRRVWSSWKIKHSLDNITFSYQCQKI